MQHIRQKGFTCFPVKYFNQKLTEAYEGEWNDGLGPVVLDCLVKDREDRKDGRQRAAKEVRDFHRLFKRIPLKYFTEVLKEAREANPPPPKWSKSLAKLNLEALVEVGFDRDDDGNQLLLENILEMDERFHLYPSFASYLKKVRETVDCRQLKADRDQAAINQHLEKHPPSQTDAPRIDISGNFVVYPKWQGSEAKNLLLQDIIFLIENDLFNDVKPKTLWLLRYEYKEYPLKVFREHIYQAIRTSKQINYNNHRKELKLSKLK